MKVEPMGERTSHWILLDLNLYSNSIMLPKSIWLFLPGETCSVQLVTSVIRPRAIQSSLDHSTPVWESSSDQSF